MPILYDLTWRPTAAVPDLPTGQSVGPAIYRGDDFDLTFRLWTDEDGTVPYEPEGTLSAQLRRSRLKANETPADPLLSFAVDVAGDDGNEVTVALTAVETPGCPDHAYWDLQEELDDGTITTWFTGKADAWGDLTR